MTIPDNNVSPMEARVASKMLDDLTSDPGVTIQHHESLSWEPDWIEVYADGTSVAIIDLPLTPTKIENAMSTLFNHRNPIK